jgi:hypothetical protein
MGTAIKAGARHSATDQEHIQTAHDRLVSAGATCAPPTKALSLPLAIKSVGGGKIEGLLVRYSTTPDLHGDIFTPQTDLGVKDGQELGLLWHHNLDPELRGLIGKGVVKKTAAGLWFASWLNRRDEYESYILKMIELGKAGYSSGAYAPGVVRQPIPGKAKAFRLAKWPVIEGSITPIPCDFQSTVSVKSMMASRGWAALSPAEKDRSIDLELQLDWLEDDVRKADLLRELNRIESPAERAARIKQELNALERSLPGRLLRPGSGSGEMIDTGDRWGIRS